MKTTFTNYRNAKEVVQEEAAECKGGWVGMDEYSNEYCGCCGQKINWSDNN